MANRMERCGPGRSKCDVVKAATRSAVKAQGTDSEARALH